MKTTLAIVAALIATPAMAEDKMSPAALTVTMHAAYKACGLSAPREAATPIITKALDESGMNLNQFKTMVEIATDEFVRVTTERGRIGRFCADMARAYQGEK